MSNFSRSSLLLLGRISVSLIFLMSAVNKIMNFQGTAEQIADKGLPAAAIFAGGAIVLELVGSVLVITGFKSRYGAWLLILFLVPTTVVMHNFWAFEGKQMEKEMINFMKNLSILGGLFVLTAVRPGSFSIFSLGDEKSGGT